MSREDYRRRLYDHYLETERARRKPATADDVPAGLADYMAALVRRHFPRERDAVITDLGCGAGTLIHFARKVGYARISGVDRSPTQIAEAARLGIADVRQGDVMAALKAMPDGSHDALIAFDVIEHFAKDELFALVDEVRRVLKPGGRWIIHVPNGGSPFGGRVIFGDFTHELAFTPASLEQILAASGFAGVRCYEDRPIPRRPSALVRWAMWHCARMAMLFALIAHSGPDARRAILSENLLAVAIR